MAPTIYTLKSGNNLWNLANGNYGAEYRNAIPGNTTNAKVASLLSINGLTEASARKLPIGYEVKLNNSATSSTSSSTATNSNKATIKTLGLQADSTTGRDFFADWTWHKHGEQTKGYRVRWEWDVPDSSDPKGYRIAYEDTETEVTWSTYTIPDEYQKTSNFVQVWITPLANTREVKNGNETTQVPYWQENEVEPVGKTYKFSSNPPRTPPAPTAEIDKDTMLLTVKYDDDKEFNASDYGATGIKFNIIQDNTVNFYTTPDPVAINLETNYVAFQYHVSAGHTYKVRACSVNSGNLESGWSVLSNEVGTKPSTPTDLSVRRDTHVDKNNDTKTYSVFLEWTPVGGVTNYEVEYTTEMANFDIVGGRVDTALSDGITPSVRIGIDSQNLGYTYYFRVKAVHDTYGTSDPSTIVELPIGVPPGPPTTWSTSNSAFAGKTTYKYDADGIQYVDYTPMELNWLHNPTDNSKQTYAQLSFNFNEEKDAKGEFVWENLEAMVNSTDVNDTEEVLMKYKYGTAVSYKGNLYFKMDTNHSGLKNTKIRWRVRTAGVTDIMDNDSWSVERTIYIHEIPDFGLSLSRDPNRNETELIETFTSFPFYIRGKLTLTDYTIQYPVGYHVQIISNDYYATVDDIGRSKTINPGDSVYSKYFSTSESTLIVQLSADNVDLESNIKYTIYCTADMSTGLSVRRECGFNVNWVDVEHAINADISINNDTYTAMITPYCRKKIPTTVGEGDDAYTTYEDGDLVENVTLSVYRREYDGTYKEIASGIPNNYTAVTDPHPALDYARYRFTAKDTNTGALSFWDAAAFPIKGSAVVIQWDEEWSSFDAGESTAIDGHSWSGSLLKLPYNIKISDKRKREKTLINYAGREHPVSYYGTQLGETSTWNVDIPASDKETIYALRRLSLWAGDVYVREPSGMGFWANVEVSFNKTYNDVKIPVTLSVTRVEGGV